jgi:hypothetical protein
MPAPSLETLDRVAAPGAAFVAEMDRSDGAFRFQVRPLMSDARAPDRDELVALLPPGSRWADALGWSAYFGWPLTAGGRHFWAVGAEEVVPRDIGAYPVVRVYLHTAPPVAVLEALARDLDPGRGRPDPLEARVVIFALTGTPLATLADQASVLLQAAEACRRNRTPLFRTAALSEPEVLPLAGIPPRLPRGVDRCFIGVPEALSRNFSARARVLLYLRGFWRPQ